MGKKIKWTDTSAIKHLESRGYTLAGDWVWEAPPGLEPSKEDKLASDYLAYEWDYGGMRA